MVDTKKEEIQKNKIPTKEEVKEVFSKTTTKHKGGKKITTTVKKIVKNEKQKPVIKKNKISEIKNQPENQEIQKDTKVKKIKKTKKTKTKKKENLLVENFIELQKAMTNMSIKFNGLSERISNLLKIFEISAKNIVEDIEKGNSPDLSKKIDILYNQNRDLARGLASIGEKLKTNPRKIPPQIQPVSKPQFGQMPFKPKILPKQ